jgi:exopolysaccharide biosynthesis polyprenyl glycosylphosphotransferase
MPSVTRWDRTSAKHTYRGSSGVDVAEAERESQGDASRSVPIAEHSLGSLVQGAPTAAWIRNADTVIALLVVVGVVFAGSDIARPIGLRESLALRISLKNLMLLGALLLIWPAALTAAGVYRFGSTARLVTILPRIVVGCAIGTAASIIVPLTSRSGVLGYGFLPAIWIGAVVGTMLLRASIRVSAFLRRTRAAPRRVVIVGAGAKGAALWASLQHHPTATYDLLGVADVESAGWASDFAQTARIPIMKLESFLMRTVVDEVLIALPMKSRYAEIEGVLRACEVAGVCARYLASAFDASLARPRLEREGSLSVVSMPVVHDDGRLLVKRVVDIVGAAVGLILLAPVFAIVAAAVRLTSAGPVFFSQERFGYRKRVFRMYKFRSMVVDAEARMQAIEHRNEQEGPIFKIREDPRVTPLGRFLRRSSLDELPQLWNVLLGDMSLVGPRPMSTRDVAKFDEPWLMRRFSVRPGLTGLWQVSGRSELPFTEWMQLDLRYIDEWSLKLDVILLCRTLPAVLRFSGAV